MARISIFQCATHYFDRSELPEASPKLSIAGYKVALPVAVIIDFNHLLFLWWNEFCCITNGISRSLLWKSPHHRGLISPCHSEHCWYHFIASIDRSFVSSAVCHFVGRRLVIARINIILQKQQNEKGYITSRKEKISLKKWLRQKKIIFN